MHSFLLRFRVKCDKICYVNQQGERLIYMEAITAREILRTCETFIRAGIPLKKITKYATENYKTRNLTIGELDIPERERIIVEGKLRRDLVLVNGINRFVNAITTGKNALRVTKQEILRAKELPRFFDGTSIKNFRRDGIRFFPRWRRTRL